MLAFVLDLVNPVEAGGGGGGGGGAILHSDLEAGTARYGGIFQMFSPHVLIKKVQSFLLFTYLINH